MNHLEVVTGTGLTSVEVTILLGNAFKEWTNSFKGFLVIATDHEVTAFKGTTPTTRRTTVKEVNSLFGQQTVVLQ